MSFENETKKIVHSFPFILPTLPLNRLKRGWCSCVVYTNEVISEIWRTNDAMSSPCSSRLYSLWHQCRGVQRYRCQACRRIFQTLRRGKDPALKQQACQLYLEGMGMRAIGRVLNIHHKTVPRLLMQTCPSTPSQLTTDRSLHVHR